MQFVALMNLRPEVDQTKLAEALARRGEYEHPAKLVAEYYTPNRKPAVVAIFEADDASQLLMNSMAWLDVFEIEVLPVIGWEEGLQVLAK